MYAALDLRLSTSRDLPASPCHNVVGGEWGAGVEQAVKGRILGGWPIASFISDSAASFAEPGKGET